MLELLAIPILQNFPSGSIQFLPVESTVEDIAHCKIFLVEASSFCQLKAQWRVQHSNRQSSSMVKQLGLPTKQHVSMMCVSLHCDKRSSTVYSPLSTIYRDIFSAVKVFTSVKLPYSLCTQDCQRIEPVHHKLKYLLPHQFKLLTNLIFFSPCVR